MTNYFGDNCEFKNQDLVLKENVSRSFSVFAIFIIIMTYVVFILLDAMRFMFKIEPEGLSEERQLIRRKKLIKKIMDDLRDKKKRKRYRKLIRSGIMQTDPFIKQFEETFKISYEKDLKYIDDESVLDLGRNSVIRGSSEARSSVSNPTFQNKKTRKTATRV